MNFKQRVQWYAMRVTYGREVKLKERLVALGMNCFLPMQYKEVVKKERVVRILVPVVHNLIFIQSSRESMDALKKQFEAIAPLRYMIDKATNLPIVIPDQQMHDFIAVAGTLDEQLIYLKDTNAAIHKGDRVQILKGVFAGVEGEVLRIKRDRRVVVTIKGILSVATAYIPNSHLRKV